MNIDKQGYMRFTLYDNGKYINIKEHRLNALINNSLHDVYNKDNIVHHKNHCKFDNRPENLEIITHNEHSIYHNINREVSFESRQKMREAKIGKYNGDKHPQFSHCIKIKKYKDNRFKNGFRFMSQPYTKDGKLCLSSVDLEKCIKKVEDFIDSPLNTYGYTSYQVNH